uniref:hypothetical protein n=1 Tax=Aerococcus urinaeequi TaxID=51665 RepID=UPI003529E4E3
ARGNTREISSVRGDLDSLSGGGRNYAVDTSNVMKYYLQIQTYSGNLGQDNKLTTKTKYTLSELDAKVGDWYTASIYIGQSGGFGSSVIVYNQNINSIRASGNKAGQGYSSVTFQVLEGDTEFNFYLGNESGFGAEYQIEAKEFQIEKGKIRTAWKPAISEQMGKAEFTIFKNDYDETAESVERRLTAIDSDEDGSFATRLNKTESTASGNTTTISDIKTKPSEQITGYQTIKERSDLYERVIGKDEAGIKSNMARMVMTDSLFKTEVIKNVPSAIGGRNYVRKSNDYYYTTNYKVAEYDLSIIPKGTKIKISLWGGIGTDARTFGVYVNNSSGTASGNSQIIELKKLDGVFGQGVSSSLSKWTAEAILNVDASKILIFGLDNNTTSPKRIEYVQIETGDYYTDWTAAPEDKASMSAITHLENSISLKVSNADLLNQINVQAEGVLIQSGTNKL